MKKTTVRIGCSSAFWGDSVTAATQLVKHGNIDYLVADYLAEVTMGILAKRKKALSKKKGSETAKGGYVEEFVTFVWKPLMDDILDKKIRVVTNAGGLDPLGLKRAIEKAALDAGREVPIVAAVYGDDILPRYSELNSSDSFVPFKPCNESDDVEKLPTNKEIESLNAYLGAEPIAAALAKGAQIVVTGRCVDSAIVLGSLVHEFGWSFSDFDLIAAGSIAGHIIECGCQATGGNFTDWELSANSPNGGYSNMGYPIVECFPDGKFIVTKPPKTGGIVTIASVGEQMVYEIGDPGSYILPDVVVDFRSVTLQQIDADKVLVCGAKGRAPTELLKVSGIYMDGFKVTGEIFIGGIDARKKALAVGNGIITKVRGMLKKFGMDDFRAVNIEALGSEHTYGPNARAEVSSTREVVLRLSAYHDEVRALNIFLMEIAPSATCMAPGIIGVTSGRPRPTGNMVHVSTLVKKTKVIPEVHVGSTAPFQVPFRAFKPSLAVPFTHPNSFAVALKQAQNSKKVFIPLVRVCVARSGDKGDSANIGVIARDPKTYPWLLHVLTADVVHAYMRHLMDEQGVVQRYELPGSFSMNFLITRCLGGGGLSSLQVDRQGKSYAQMLLSMKIEFPESWLSKL